MPEPNWYDPEETLTFEEELGPKGSIKWPGLFLFVMMLAYIGLGLLDELRRLLRITKKDHSPYARHQTWKAPTTPKSEWTQ